MYKVNSSNCIYILVSIMSIVFYYCNKYFILCNSYSSYLIDRVNIVNRIMLACCYFCIFVHYVLEHYECMFY